ncbi:SpoIVB peptidase [Defluviitalea raffinosedens]|uniref:SpoIVB peptidase n=1 Tax=Defluviitalea raffinosedens TaxID=1450156 RepID=A0A7C8HGF1_9FIRM|nr:SpoIVB peptidase [Defluviitalea raffinosedens]MBM7685518.1 stage IV sporulation protein B [Defluviitalea raffinosedens]HHW66753.1 SpoIVB peptidase [Candidatus Epulonipiscium sp.]
MKFGKKKHCKSLKIGILFIFLIAFISPFIASFLYIPEEIQLVAGREHEFKFNVPLQAKIVSDQQGVLKVNNRPIDQKDIDISLQEPFSIQSDEKGTLDVKLKLLGVLPLKTVKVDVISPMEVVPCGMTVGVNVATDGIMVLGTGNVNGIDGKVYEPSKGVLESGDLILEVNGKPLENKEQLIDFIENSNNKKLKMKVKREDEIIEASIQPIKSQEDKRFKIGAWVRDQTQGIGTITYYNPNSNSFGALGHGITDIDTKKLMPIKSGKIMKAEITSIKKGQKGIPGELTGAIYDTEESRIGSVELNTTQGIFGKIDPHKSDMLPNETVPIGLQHEIHEGKAVIRSNISGNKIEEFDIYIQKISKFNQDASKGMIVKITDPRLLDKTNGIVQGMSGSPILQDGKLIGAITHVFVQDPTKGYGIFIESMLKKEDLME